MRIPAFVHEHPVESLIAGILLLALMFGPTDRYSATAAHHTGALVASVQKL